MSHFKFDLKEDVIISCSGESGEIIGRAEYVSWDDQYFIRYKAADGRAEEEWWSESALFKKVYEPSI